MTIKDFCLILFNSLVKAAFEGLPFGVRQSMGHQALLPGAAAGHLSCTGAAGWD